MKLFPFVFMTAFCTSLAIPSIGWGQNADDLSWLIGMWKSEESGKVVMESWSKQDDATLIGASKTTKNGKEVFAESLRMEFGKGTITYVAELPSKTAKFALENISDNQVSFIDSENDFPNRIIYKKSKGGIEITLEGKSKGEVKTEVILLSKN